LVPSATTITREPNPLLRAILFSLLLPLAAVGDVLQRAPSFVLPGAGEQPVVFQSGSSETPTLILFWATWCPYCAALMPELQKVRKAYSEEQLRIIAVHVFDEEGDPVAHLKSRGFDFTLARDGDEVAAEYGVRGTPGLFLADRNGVVAYTRISGSKPEMVREALVKAMEDLLDADGRPR
jgi:thiol-disulfide isomerase/thioredoxin